MSNSVFTVSIHSDNGSVDELITGVWEQTFSNFERAQELYELVENKLSELEEEYIVVLRTIKVTDYNEPYELQVYNDDEEVFENFEYNRREEIVSKILESLQGEV